MIIIYHQGFQDFHKQAPAYLGAAIQDFSFIVLPEICIPTM